MLEFDIPAAVQGAFALVGYHGPLEVLGPDDDDERLFVVAAEDLAKFGERARQLERVLVQILHLKVAIIPANDEYDPVPFAAPSMSHARAAGGGSDARCRCNSVEVRFNV